MALRRDRTRVADRQIRDADTVNPTPRVDVEVEEVEATDSGGDPDGGATGPGQGGEVIHTGGEPLRPEDIPHIPHIPQRPRDPHPEGVPGRRFHPEGRGEDPLPGPARRTEQSVPGDQSESGDGGDGGSDSGGGDTVILGMTTQELGIAGGVAAFAALLARL